MGVREGPVSIGVTTSARPHVLTEVARRPGDSDRRDWLGGLVGYGPIAGLKGRTW